MTIHINSDVAHAMAVQVKRVNKEKSAADLAAELAIAYQTIDRLRAQLRTRQDASAAADRAALDAPDQRDARGEMLDGQRVFTIKQAAAKSRGRDGRPMHYQSAYRRVISGKWRAVKLPSGDWRVFADQPLT